MSETVKQLTQNTIHPSDVAKAILEAVTSDTPDFQVCSRKRWHYVFYSSKAAGFNLIDLLFLYYFLIPFNRLFKWGELQQTNDTTNSKM